jgi:hypothetical protein
MKYKTLFAVIMVVVVSNLLTPVKSAAAPAGEEAQPSEYSSGVSLHANSTVGELEMGCTLDGATNITLPNDDVETIGRVVLKQFADVTQLSSQSAQQNPVREEMMACKPDVAEAIQSMEVKRACSISIGSNGNGVQYVLQLRAGFPCANLQTFSVNMMALVTILPENPLSVDKISILNNDYR